MKHLKYLIHGMMALIIFNACIVAIAVIISYIGDFIGNMILYRLGEVLTVTFMAGFFLLSYLFGKVIHDG